MDYPVKTMYLSHDTNPIKNDKIAIIKQNKIYFMEYNSYKMKIFVESIASSSTHLNFSSL